MMQTGSPELHHRLRWLRLVTAVSLVVDAYVDEQPQLAAAMWDQVHPDDVQLATMLLCRFAAARFRDHIGDDPGPIEVVMFRTIDPGDPLPVGYDVAGAMVAGFLNNDIKGAVQAFEATTAEEASGCLVALFLAAAGLRFDSPLSLAGTLVDA